MDATFARMDWPARTTGRPDLDSAAAPTSAPVHRCAIDLRASEAVARRAAAHRERECALGALRNQRMNWRSAQSVRDVPSTACAHNRGTSSMYECMYVCVCVYVYMYVCSAERKGWWWVWPRQNQGRPNGSSTNCEPVHRCPASPSHQDACMQRALHPPVRTCACSLDAESAGAHLGHHLGWH